MIEQCVTRTSVITRCLQCVRRDAHRCPCPRQGLLAVARTAARVGGVCRPSFPVFRTIATDNTNPMLYLLQRYG
jgi:hypothetical protein